MPLNVDIKERNKRRIILNSPKMTLNIDGAVEAARTSSLTTQLVHIHLKKPMLYCIRMLHWPGCSPVDFCLCTDTNTTYYTKYKWIKITNIKKVHKDSDDSEYKIFMLLLHKTAIEKTKKFLVKTRRNSKERHCFQIHPSLVAFSVY